MTTILVGIAIILLALHWRGPNAVWGGATLGLIVGVIVALVTGHWYLVPRIIAIGIFAGTIFEWIGRLTSRGRRGGRPFS